MRPSEYDPEGWAVPEWATGPGDLVVTMRRKQIVKCLRRVPPTGLALPAGVRPSQWLPEARRHLVAEGRFEICWHFDPWDPDYGPWEAAMEAYAAATRERRKSGAPSDPPLYELKRRADALMPDSGGRWGFRWQLTPAQVVEWAEDRTTLAAWFDVDHVVPLMADGPHAMTNLQLLCKKCHLDKSRRERGGRKTGRRKTARVR